ncbi:hypothetical protein AOL_s00091g31 [Orbilia oligospora ATCC 24927]|uniref:chitinase n=1 Tax=Arthrobotrys oligospora (strain ATCC 24927 / CBS 115.81 / DSM 1491) TaxID=756982 RepID=G1XHX9_ARTOA|nr:hypothetical protein AOL_s00091g31 [Orbilia oligospora ATCC 24927]EGX47210.1 hypothetical protein AOL_s00091g31 [Orbilia oligospora ATCC 24927]
MEAQEDPKGFEGFALYRRLDVFAGRRLFTRVRFSRQKRDICFVGNEASQKYGIRRDWEYPRTETEKNHYVDLLAQCRRYLDELGDGYELSVAAPSDPLNVSNLNLREMDRFLDFWNLMAYDFVGGWSTTAGHQANLHRDPGNSRSTGFSVDDALRLYSSIPSYKLVLGMPMYGHSFITDGPGEVAQPYSDHDRVWNYKELPPDGATEYVQEDIAASWSYDPARRLFTSYDNPSIAKLKAEYIINKKLGGAMWWETSGDRKDERSLIMTVVEHLGVGRLDRKNNHLAYPYSEYENIRNQR